MTRRRFLFTGAAAQVRTDAPPLLIIPIRQVFDRRATYMRNQLRRFNGDIWPEAVRDFAKCAIQFATTWRTGEIRRSPSGRPIFTDLDREAINLVLTDLVPMAWDNARGLAGVTTRYEGNILCVIALGYAHGHQIPFVSVNTCVHELLHALLQDVFEARPAGVRGEVREIRIDAYATWLWLFGEGADIRHSAGVYLSRAIIR